MPTTTKFIWDDDNLLAEADATDTINVVYTNEPQQYGNLISSRISGATSYHHFDGLGSTRQLTNAGATVTDVIVYEVWGAAVARRGETLAFQLWVGEIGYYYDTETGVWSIRERPYDSRAGRWSTVDVLLFSELQNRYTYGRNGPSTQVDPSGMVCCSVSDFNVTPDQDCNVYKIAGGKQLVVGEQFKTHADFKTAAGDGPRCRCCEYRQYVDGTAKTRFRIAKGGAIVPVPPWVTIGSYGEYQEDVSAQGRPYGHRKGYPNSPVDKYERDRPAGCAYSGIDYPGVDITKGMPALKTGQAVELDMDYHFLLNIIDVCNGNRVVDSKMVGIRCCVFALFNTNVNGVVVLPPDDPLQKFFKPACGG